jgi:Ni/Co efflux regulator RcnB
METEMKMKAIASAIMAVSLATGGFASAQNYGDRNDRPQRNDQGDRRDDQGRQQDHRDDRGRGQQNRDQRGDWHGDRQQGERQGERGAGPNHEFYRGQRLPPEYRNRQYVVDDWRGHHLNAPPRGYHWVQTGGDYVLVAISTGIILQLLLNN